MLLGLLLYGYAIGERSSRRLERACETDVAFQVLAANQRPDHATIARFRSRHRDAIEEVFVQVVGLCVSAGLIGAWLVAVDSTKLGAAALADTNLTREQLEVLGGDWMLYVALGVTKPSQWSAGDFAREVVLKGIFVATIGAAFYSLA
jgi:hypothetical protein